MSIERDITTIIEEAVAELEVPDTRAWYIRLLDSLFGYDPAA